MQEITIFPSPGEISDIDMSIFRHNTNEMPQASKVANNGMEPTVSPDRSIPNWGSSYDDDDYYSTGGRSDSVHSAGNNDSIANIGGESERNLLGKLAPPDLADRDVDESNLQPFRSSGLNSPPSRSPPPDPLEGGRSGNGGPAQKGKLLKRNSERSVATAATELTAITMSTVTTAMPTMPARHSLLTNTSSLSSVPLKRRKSTGALSEFSDAMDATSVDDSSTDNEDESGLPTKIGRADIKEGDNMERRKEKLIREKLRLDLERLEAEKRAIKARLSTEREQVAAEKERLRAEVERMAAEKEKSRKVGLRLVAEKREVVLEKREIKAEKEKLEEEVEQLEAEKERIKKRLAEEKKRAEEELKAVKQRLIKEKRAVVAEKREIKAEKEKLEEDVEQIAWEKEKIKEKLVTEKEEVKEKLEEDIEQLEAEKEEIVEQLEAEKEEIQEKLEAEKEHIQEKLEAEKRQVQVQAIRLKAEKEDQKRRHTIDREYLNARIEELRKQVDDAVKAKIMSEAKLETALNADKSISSDSRSQAEHSRASDEHSSASAASLRAQVETLRRQVERAQRRAAEEEAAKVAAQRRADREAAAANWAATQHAEAAFDPMFSIDSSGTILTANRAAVDTFGWTLDELVGTDVSTTICGDTGIQDIVGKKKEVRARRKDGSDFPAEMGVWETVVSHEGGESEVIFGALLRDITKEKEVAEQLKAEKAEIKEKLIAEKKELVEEKWEVVAEKREIEAEKDKLEADVELLEAEKEEIKEKFEASVELLEAEKLRVQAQAARLKADNAKQHERHESVKDSLLSRINALREEVEKARAAKAMSDAKLETALTTERSDSQSMVSRASESSGTSASEDRLRARIEELSKQVEAAKRRAAEEAAAKQAAERAKREAMRAKAEADAMLREVASSAVPPPVSVPPPMSPRGRHRRSATAMTDADFAKMSPSSPSHHGHRRKLSYTDGLVENEEACHSYNDMLALGGMDDTERVEMEQKIEKLRKEVQDTKKEKEKLRKERADAVVAKAVVDTKLRTALKTARRSSLGSKVTPSEEELQKQVEEQQAKISGLKAQVKMEREMKEAEVEEAVEHAVEEALEQRVEEATSELRQEVKEAEYAKHLMGKDMADMFFPSNSFGLGNTIVEEGVIKTSDAQGKIAQMEKELHELRAEKLKHQEDMWNQKQDSDKLIFELREKNRELKEKAKENTVNKWPKDEVYVDNLHQTLSRIVEFLSSELAKEITTKCALEIKVERLKKQIETKTTSADVNHWQHTQNSVEPGLICDLRPKGTNETSGQLPENIREYTTDSLHCNQNALALRATIPGKMLPCVEAGHSTPSDGANFGEHSANVDSERLNDVLDDYKKLYEMKSLALQEKETEIEALRIENARLHGMNYPSTTAYFVGNVDPTSLQ